MIKPRNGHLLIEPVEHKMFLPSHSGTYEEIGIVIDPGDAPVKNGDKVYFDSWLAAKYPKNDDEFYWLVKWEDVRGVEINEDTLPKLSLS